MGRLQLAFGLALALLVAISGRYFLVNQVPLPKKRGTVGVVVTREELDRDDSLVAFMAARSLLGVREGEKERGTIVKLYAELGPLTVFVFHNDIDNPFPQASAIVPIGGPFAFQGPGSGKTGAGVRFRASF